MKNVTSALKGLNPGRQVCGFKQVFPPTSRALAARWLVASVVLNTAATSIFAASIPLADQPGGTGSREPSPNVIVTVDDSGSMQEDTNGVNPPINGLPSKMTALKAALLAQFGDPSNPSLPGRMPDNRIRLAWQSMWASGGTTGAKTLVPGATNTMKPFSGAHRTNFANFVKGLSAGGGTPSHSMMLGAFNYMKSAQGTNSPWADNPGNSQTTPYLSCRRAYHIFLTDGGWNGENNESAGNADGTLRTLPDGKAFNPYPAVAPPLAAQQFNVYKDTFGGIVGRESTLADLAFAAWATDLQDGSNSTASMSNSVNAESVMRVKTNEVVGGVTLEPYWNPKNDPATWQHMVTHTIGFGSGSINWTNNAGGALRPLWDTVSDSNYGGDYVNLVNNTVTWPDPSALGLNGRPVELWHIALNGRGRFYPAKDANALQSAFSDILDNVLIDTSAPSVSVATNSKRLTTDTVEYEAGYKAGVWSGSLKAYKRLSTGLRSPTSDWSASDLMDDNTKFDPSTRVVISFDGSAGIPFRWDSLPSSAPATLRGVLNGPDNRGSDRVNYLRGDRSGESLATNPFRSRATRLGDIVNSSLTYLGRPRSGSRQAAYSTFATQQVSRKPMLYVGGNDGMLHGFEAATGLERLAYVPQGVYSNFVNFTDPAYAHKYFVDGSPFSADVYVGGASPWKTMLANTLGAGGKGYFVLDVTNPSNFSETNASSLVILDRTGTSDPDVGFIFNEASKGPTNSDVNVQFTVMNNGRPALIFGNGINSTNERPVLLIQYLDGAKEVLPIVASTTTGQANGLSVPQVIDLNNDGTADLIYAGDLKGNLWKFDVSSATATNWKVSFSGNPLFTAVSSTGNTQPITTAPVWLPHPKGGIMVGFGTGRTVTLADRTDTSEQTFYGVWDNSLVTVELSSVTVIDDALKRITTGRTSLVEQVMGNSVATSDANGRDFYNSTNYPVNYGTTGVNPNRRGWYMNMRLPKERASENSEWSTGDFIRLLSSVPSGSTSNSESCSLSASPENGFGTTVNLINGAAPKVPIFDTNGDGVVNSTDSLANKISNVGKGIVISSGGKNSVILCPTCGVGGTANPIISLPSTPGITLNWRER